MALKDGSLREETVSSGFHGALGSSDRYLQWDVCHAVKESDAECQYDYPSDRFRNKAKLYEVELMPVDTDTLRAGGVSWTELSRVTRKISCRFYAACAVPLIEQASRNRAAPNT